jgi:hypothetical protein
LTIVIYSFLNAIFRIVYTTQCSKTRRTAWSSLPEYPKTILEIYIDSAAYQKYIVTPHFKKYKATVEHIVKKLELVDVTRIESARQPDCNYKLPTQQNEFDNL